MNNAEKPKTIAEDFEHDLLKLVSKYVKEGLKKPDLIKKLKYVLGSAEIS
jgi:hypothetical protein